MLLDEEHFIAVEDPDNDQGEGQTPNQAQDEMNKSEYDDNLIFKTSHKVTLVHKKLQESLSESGSRNFLEVIESVEAGPLLDPEELAEMSFSEVPRIASASKPPTQPKLQSSPGYLTVSERTENNPYIKKSGLISLAESFKAPDLNASTDNVSHDGNILEPVNPRSQEEKMESDLKDAEEMIDNYQYTNAIILLEKLIPEFEKRNLRLKESKSRKLLSDALFQDNVAPF